MHYPTACEAIAEGLPIPEGVRLVGLQDHADERGVFRELYRDAWAAAATPVQWNMAWSKPNVLRGVHVHIDHFDQHVGMTFSRDFYGCFEKVYYSYEMGKRKPDREVFDYLIRKHDLNPARTLFVDDKKENTDAALAAGLKVWNLQPGVEDVIDLFDKKYHLA